MGEIPFEEIYERVLKKTCERFGFVFSPNIDEYTAMSIRFVEMYVPRRFNITEIEDNISIIEQHEEEVIERLEYLLEQYNDVLRKIKAGKNGVLEVKLNTIVNMLNTEVVEYICYEVAKEVIYERYGDMLDEYSRDVSYLQLLKSKHKSKYFRKYLDRLFEEKYGSGAVDKVKVVVEEPFIHEEEVTGIKPPPLPREFNDTYKRIIAERYNIPLDKVDEFLAECEYRQSLFWSGALLDELRRRAVEAGFDSYEFMKKKKRGGEETE